MADIARELYDGIAPSRQLLRQLLSAREYEDILMGLDITVPSSLAPLRVYTFSATQGIRAFYDGVPVASFCFGPESYLPPYDLVLIYKMFLEGAEELFLATANIFLTPQSTIDRALVLTYYDTMYGRVCTY